MRLPISLLLFALAATAAHAAGSADPDYRYFVGFGAGPQSGNGLHLGFTRGAQAVDLGVGLLYDSQNAEWGYSTGLRYLHFLYTGRANDTYAWGGGALTGNYRDQKSSQVTSIGAGLGVSFHFGLPIHIYFDSGLAAYLTKGLETREYYPAFNGGVVYAW